MLLPLEKGRAGDEAPTFVVDLVYLQGDREPPGSTRDTTALELPALDLPVSRTGVELYYPPRFRVEPQTGSLRVEDDPGPFAEALRQPVAATVAATQKDATDRAAAGPAGARRQVQERIRRPLGRRLAACSRRVSGVWTIRVPGLRADRRSQLAIRRARVQAGEVGGVTMTRLTTTTSDGVLVRGDGARGRRPAAAAARGNRRGPSRSRCRNTTG